MAEVTIDSAQLAELQGAYKVAAELMRNPKTKDRAQALVKEVAPGASLPEYEIKSEMQKRLDKMQETLDGFIKGQKETRETEKFQADWKGAIERHLPGLTEDGEKAMVKMMTERNIADPEAGALLWKQMNPPQQPIDSSPWASSTLFDTSKEGELAGWFSNPDQKRDQEISATLAEFRNR